MLNQKLVANQSSISNRLQGRPAAAASCFVATKKEADWVQESWDRRRTFSTEASFNPKPGAGWTTRYQDWNARLVYRHMGSQTVCVAFECACNGVWRRRLTLSYNNHNPWFRESDTIVFCPPGGFSSSSRRNLEATDQKCKSLKCSFTLSKAVIWN